MRKGLCFQYVPRGVEQGYIYTTQDYFFFIIKKSRYLSTRRRREGGRGRRLFRNSSRSSGTRCSWCDRNLRGAHLAEGGPAPDLSGCVSLDIVQSPRRVFFFLPSFFLNFKKKRRHRASAVPSKRARADGLFFFLHENSMKIIRPRGETHTNEHSLEKEKNAKIGLSFKTWLISFTGGERETTLRTRGEKEEGRNKIAYT